MKLSKRWKYGLLITAWIAVVAVMVRYAYPNSFRRAAEFNSYQQGLTRAMTESGARQSGAPPANAAPAAAPPAAEPPPAAPAD